MPARDEHIGAALREAARHRLAQTLVPAGDEGDTTAQIE